MLENEIPAMDHPVVKQYLHGREGLINEEDKERSGEPRPAGLFRDHF